jgi:precorrin-3B methylase
MVQRVATVAFEGIEARAVDVQVQVAPGLPAFNVVGSIVDNRTQHENVKSVHDVWQCPIRREAVSAEHEDQESGPG